MTDQEIIDTFFEKYGYKISRAPTDDEIESARKFLDGLSHSTMHVEGEDVTKYYNGGYEDLYLPGLDRDLHAIYLACRKIAIEERFYTARSMKKDHSC